MIPFATDISAVMEAEFVFVLGANQVSEGIQVAIGQQGPGMRTFLSAGKKLVVVFGKAYCFAVYVHFGQSLAIEADFGEIVGYLMPLICH